MKLLKKIFLGLLLVFVLIQFYSPEKNTTHGNHTKAFIAETNPTNDLKLVLQQSCYDCHSNCTAYPWYNNIAPISFWLANHIQDGKKELNFSEWDSYNLRKKDRKLEEIEEMVANKEMPIKVYTWSHLNSRLTDKQRSEVVTWAKNTRLLYQAKLLQD